MTYRAKNPNRSGNRNFNSQNKSKNFSNKTKSNKAVESSLAANVPASKYSKGNTERKVWCNMCKGLHNNDHKMYRCPNFVTSREKIDRLKTIKACTKCGFANHQGNSCSYQFKHPCRHCSSQSHFSWLCSTNLEAKKGVEEGVNNVDSSDSDSFSGDGYDYSYSDIGEESEGHEPSDTEDVRISMCQVTSTKMSLPSNAILPTFQAEVNGVNARGLKDSGCQKNFLSSALFKAANLTAGKQIELTINGFNSSKKYRTYETKVPLKFGGVTHVLDMIVLPDVATRFAADGIGCLAAGFEEKGYLLADPAFVNDRNVVEDLDLVLGIEATFVFMEKVISYGEHGQCHYLETRGGVMPIGHSLTGYANLKFLPSKKSKILQPGTVQNSESKPKPSSASRVIPKNEALKKEKRKKEDLVKKKVAKIKVPVPPPVKNKFDNKKAVPKMSVKSPKTSLKPQDKKAVKKKIKKTVNKVSTDGSSTRVAIATPAAIEVKQIFERVGSLTEKINDNDNGNDDSLKLGKHFLNSLTPGYTKIETFGQCDGYGAASDIDLDHLMTSVLGYDQYEKTEPFTKLDSEIVDHVYYST